MNGRNRRARRGAALVCVVATLLLLPLPVASAHGSDQRGDDHGWQHRHNGTSVHNVVAKAVNRRDNRTRIDAETDLVRTHSRRVEAHVGAYAYSSCTDCRTAAVGLQVLVASRVSDLVVASDAVAINEHCVRCDTLAVAYQFAVASTNSRLHLERGAVKQLRRLERQLERAVEGSDSNAVALTETDALASQILALLQGSVWVDAPDDPADDDADAGGVQPPAPGAPRLPAPRLAAASRRRPAAGGDAAPLVDTQAAQDDHVTSPR